MSRQIVKGMALYRKETNSWELRMNQGVLKELQVSYLNQPRFNRAFVEAILADPDCEECFYHRTLPRK